MFRKKEKEKDTRNSLERSGWKKTAEDDIFDIYSKIYIVYDREQHHYIDKVLTVYSVKDTFIDKQLDETVS